MRKEVVIKSNRYGMELVLDDKLPFPELLQIIEDTFRESGDFFKNGKAAIGFSGRQLSGEEELAIVDRIMEVSPVQIVSIMSQGGVQEARMKERVEESRRETRKEIHRRGEESGRAEAAGGQIPQGELVFSEPAADFFKGNLRSGQVLECPSNVTLIGDVNPGARIVSGGSVVVLGSLKGNACAGLAGDDGNCFIFALDMQPIQLQIGDLIAKSPDKESGAKRPRRSRKAASNTYFPQIAVARDGNICIEPMTKDLKDPFNNADR